MDTHQAKASVFTFFAALVPYARQYPLLVIGLLVLFSLDAIIILAVSIGYKELVNHFSSDTDFVMIVIAILGVVMSMVFVGYIIANFLTVSLCKKVQFQLRKAMFDQLHRINYVRFSKLNPDSLLPLYTLDIAHVERSLTQNVPSIIQKIYITLSGVVLLSLLAWQVAAVTILMALFMVVTALSLQKKSAHMSHAKKTVEADGLSLINENIELNALIRTFNLVNFYQNKYSDTLSELADYQAKENLYTDGVIVSVKILFYLLLLFSTILSTYLIVHHELTVGAYIASITIVGSLTAALIELLRNTAQMLSASISMGKIKDFLAEAGANKAEQPGVAVGQFKQSLQFDQVSFSYREGKSVLSNITFSLKAGSSLGIVGHSGSGKSTLLSLILNLYQPAQGNIYLDGINVKDIQLESYYDLMTVVPQEPPLFSDTIFENIRLDRADRSLEEVIAAAEAVHLHEFIVSLPEGYDTKIQRISNRLSGGQKQRIAMARALVRDSPILIFDEVTSALDPDNEAQIIKLIDAMHGKHSIIHITHRLAALKNMDNIIVIEEGKVVETGTHYDLLSAKGFYANMWETQHSFEISADGTEIKIKIDYMRKIPLFSIIPDARLEKLAHLFSIVRTEENGVLITEGDVGDQFYIIVSGTVSVTRWQNEVQQEISVLDEGDYFGEIALLKNVPRAATVTAKTSVVLLTLAQENFQKIVREEKGLLELLQKTMQERLLNS